MKYIKGDFILTPNKAKLKGLSPNLQVLFMWLCEHSDDTMQSFPSRATLANECGMSVRTLDRSMQELVGTGMVAKSARVNNNEQSTNLYEVVIFAQGGDKSARGGDKMTPGGRQKQHTELTPINSTHPTHSTNVLVETQRVYDLYCELFNKNQASYKLTDKRKQKLRTRLRDAGYEMLEQAIRATAASSFHRGDNDRGWEADLDFIIRSYEQVEKLASKDDKKSINLKEYV